MAGPSPCPHRTNGTGHPCFGVGSSTVDPGQLPGYHGEATEQDAPATPSGNRGTEPVHPGSPSNLNRPNPTSRDIRSFRTVGRGFWVRTASPPTKPPWLLPEPSRGAVFRPIASVPPASTSC